MRFLTHFKSFYIFMSKVLSPNMVVKRPNTDCETSPIPTKAPCLEDTKNLSKKRTHAVLLMYSGCGYYGMQR